MAEVAQKSFTIAYYVMSQQQSQEADISIHPNLEGIGTFDNVDVDAIYEVGYLATYQQMEQIKKLLKQKKIL
jgi:predicted acylesterase/phospholipase RssA